MITPNIPIPSTNTHSEQMLITGLRNRLSGIIGSGERDSTEMNAASITADPISSDTTRVDPHPYVVAQVSASSSGTTQAISVANPGQSSWRAAARGFMCGNCIEIAVTATAPTGRLTQKQARHDH